MDEAVEDAAQHAAAQHAVENREADQWKAPSYMHGATPQTDDVSLLMLEAIVRKVAVALGLAGLNGDPMTMVTQLCDRHTDLRRDLAAAHREARLQEVAMRDQGSHFAVLATVGPPQAIQWIHPQTGDRYMLDPRECVLIYPNRPDTGPPPYRYPAVATTLTTDEAPGQLPPVVDDPKRPYPPRELIQQLTDVSDRAAAQWGWIHGYDQAVTDRTAQRKAPPGEVDVPRLDALRAAYQRATEDAAQELIENGPGANADQWAKLKGQEWLAALHAAWPTIRANLVSP